MPVLLLQFDNLLQPQASLNLGVKLVVKFLKNPMLLIVNEKKMGNLSCHEYGTKKKF